MINVSVTFSDAKPGEKPLVTRRSPEAALAFLIGHQLGWNGVITDIKQDGALISLHTRTPKPMTQVDEIVTISGPEHEMDLLIEFAQHYLELLARKKGESRELRALIDACLGITMTFTIGSELDRVGSQAEEKLCVGAAALYMGGIASVTEIENWLKSQPYDQRPEALADLLGWQRAGLPFEKALAAAA